MTPKQVRKALDNIDKMLEKAELQSVREYETAQAIGALVLAVAYLRDVVSEILMTSPMTGLVKDK